MNESGVSAQSSSPAVGTRVLGLYRLHWHATDYGVLRHSALCHQLTLLGLPASAGCGESGERRVRQSSDVRVLAAL